MDAEIGRTKENKMRNLEITWCILSDSSPYFPQHVAEYDDSGTIKEFEQIKNRIPYETEEEFFARVEANARADFGEDVDIIWEHNPYLGGCPL
jgi:hypothetical protein